MKISVIGATGKAGSKIVQEAKNRGHDVTAIVRDPSKLTDSSIAAVQKDIFDLSPSDLQPYDVVVNAFGAPLGEEQPHVDAGRALIHALKGNQETRLIVVGGAGSLYVDEDKTTMVAETPEFPEAVLPTAKGQGRNLEDLQDSKDINWTFVSPSAVFDPDGKRTGTYQKGKDQLLVNSKGESYISYADYAIAIVDEIENAEHIKERYTVVAETE